MDGDAQDSLEAAMHTLRAEYLAESPERVRELSAALGRLRVKDATALADLQRHFHRLAGSGGSYGFPLVTDRSRAGELAVSLLAREGRPLVREDFAVLERHVLGVADAFRDAQRHFARGAPR
ncbi:MAG: Hpt domain-containing protein [Gemmatimonadales bacterium]|jgi:chemotaxis protein histidine kinase CheA